MPWSLSISSGNSSGRCNFPQNAPQPSIRLTRCECHCRELTAEAERRIHPTAVSSHSKRIGKAWRAKPPEDNRKRRRIALHWLARPFQPGCDGFSTDGTQSPFSIATCNRSTKIFHEIAVRWMPGISARSPVFVKQFSKHQTGGEDSTLTLICLLWA